MSCKSLWSIYLDRRTVSGISKLGSVCVCVSACLSVSPVRSSVRSKLSSLIKKVHHRLSLKIYWGGKGTKGLGVGGSTKRFLNQIFQSELSGAAARSEAARGDMRGWGCVDGFPGLIF